jgi:hypothetical protein
VKRRLFNLAAAVSLVMMLAVVALWVRSYWKFDSITALNERGFYSDVWSEHGKLRFGWLSGGLRGQDPDSGLRWFRYSRDADPAVRAEGSKQFHYSSRDFGRNGHATNLVLPYWFVALFTAPLPASWIFKRQRAPRRDGPRRCAVCGYDLRATPDRCPECGTPSTSSGQTPVAAKPAEAAA